MQTEIDLFLKEQNDLLSQQINLLTEQNKALNQQTKTRDLAKQYERD